MYRYIYILVIYINKTNDLLKYLGQTRHVKNSSMIKYLILDKCAVGVLALMYENTEPYHGWHAQCEVLSKT